MTADQLFIGDQPAFDLTGMVRATDKPPAKAAAVASLPVVEQNRRLILRLLVEHEWITMFCPYVLVGPEYRQTVIGPRFPSLERSLLIEHIGSRRPRDGAESSRLVSAYRITDKGRDYLAAAETTA